MENEVKTSNRPTHDLYVVETFGKDGNEKSNWNRIGSAWQHADGKGFNLNLVACPTDGRLVMRVREDNKSE